MSHTTECCRRSAQELKAYQKKEHSLLQDGFLLEWDSSDISKILAVVLGPADTVYAGGFFFFQIDLPATYPQAPPKVTFLTQCSQSTRLHPNLYTNGYVCLSILGSWHGESWRPAFTVEAVIRTIRMACLGMEQPLLCEPGSSPSQSDMDAYNAVVEYACLEAAIISPLTQPPPDFNKDCFLTPMREVAAGMKAQYMKRLERLKARWGARRVSCSYYGLNIHLDVERYRERLQDVCDSHTVIYICL
ncbi:hypothetical protein KIPB_008211 [Kipferlia bialata]|uniref:Ubiquitin-conjugating enzyme E2 Z n=1 Tax=Kipferlia bialata TaxID=797122 RepID=A0A391NXF6_9EUKA|nr:hypothetical protein KIPB_008211 [Kipferlia bialata]|eukprot:g8211.t1